MSETVTIIGDGAMGTICGIMLAENGHRVRIWSAFEEQAQRTAELRENQPFLPGVDIPEEIALTADETAAFDGATIVMSAVPAQFVRAVWERVGPHCPAGIPVCSVTKGIENGTLLRPTEIIAERCGEAHYPAAVLSGPCIAPEVARKLPATVTVASPDQTLAERIQNMITRPYFRVYTGDDLLGVEFAGAIKNVIAIAAGIVDGMGLGCNAKSALVSRGLAEITRLGIAVGAKPETFAGLSGLGDLVTTCISPVGRNRSFGEAVGRGMSVDDALAATASVVEGVATTASVVELAAKTGVDMPLSRAVHAVVFDGSSPAETVRDLMNRPLRPEAEERRMKGTRRTPCG